MKKEMLVSFCWSLFYMQIYGDPEAADVVFTSGADITVVGINITTQLKLSGEEASPLISFSILDITI